ncbi:MAG: penicillin-insensitive murein endopeptidase [Gammaproteobacteria bacterium]|nr:penicillin-insensitive murein endopeptidase [Gammaproteobacteria bacterium]MDH5650296.1 penicillin-insensitive murein endopeptidase [Gammaproteobacteria bacterium]
MMWNNRVLRNCHYLSGLLAILLTVAPGAATARSICYGNTSYGRLENGVQLPLSGENFVAYGKLPVMAGRTYVHSKVHTIVLAAYKSLATSHPGKMFIYGETGLINGGKFKPHKTHQNGLSVDFLVPVFDAEGQPSRLPTNVVNKYGYTIDFDSSGQYGDYRIDFDTLGAHLVALHKAAQENGVSLWRVIFAPDLQDKLYATQYGDYIKKHILIPKKRSWVRHDEHYHVDFRVKCRR